MSHDLRDIHPTALLNFRAVLADLCLICVNLKNHSAQKNQLDKFSAMFGFTFAVFGCGREEEIK